MKKTSLTDSYIHKAIPGKDAGPKHLADGYERSIIGSALLCQNCDKPIGYGEFVAHVEDSQVHNRLVYTVTHKADCSRW